MIESKESLFVVGFIVQNSAGVITNALSINHRDLSGTTTAKVKIKNHLSHRQKKFTLENVMLIISLYDYADFPGKNEQET